MLNRALAGCAAALFCLFTGAAIEPLRPQPAADSRPNILWILSEDISTDLGCYGMPVVQTPVLDKMAREGVRYTNAFTTAPVCSPSRSAMITGMYQTSIGAHNHRSHRDDGYVLPNPVKPITDYLREAGYFTVNVKTAAPGLNMGPKTDFNFNLDHAPFDGSDWNERKPGQPFFAQLTIAVTHRGKAWSTVVKQHEPHIDPATVVMPPFYPDHPVARADWATYLESIQLMDSYVGRILQRLRDEKIDRNTLVIFIGDNGRCHVRDKQFLYDGGLHIPMIMYWPGPAGEAFVKPGQVNTDLVSAIDISATVLSMAGIKPPAYMEGQPLLGPNVKKRDYIIGARDRMDETVDKMRCVRDKQFKYIKNYMPERPYMQPNKYKETEYPMWNLLKELNQQGKLTPAQAKFVAATKPAEELYDITADPYELNNLATVPKYAKTLTRMRTILDNWVKTTGDKGQYAEAKNAVPKPEN